MAHHELSLADGGEALRAIFSAALNRTDRLPALEATLERAATICTDELRNSAVPPPELTFLQVESGVAGDILSPYEGRGVAAVFNAADWNTRLLTVADRACVFAVIEMMLGGDGSQPAHASDRAFTRIELGMMSAFFGRLAQSLEAAFAPIVRTTFTNDGISDRIDFDILGRKTSQAVAARLSLRVWSQTGEILIVIPGAAIEPMRQALGPIAVEETKKADPRWSSQIQDKITRTSVALTAILDERFIPLEDIANLRVGQMLQLGATAQTRVRVECNGEPLLWCQLGKSNGAYTLRVDAPIDRDEEFMNDILAG
ncbi:MAG: flagellar motor switch protein FliM [Hyphomicrobiaceae bacterium]